eukprot:5361195-Pleurochrysis_carterae.AAC.1
MAHTIVYPHNGRAATHTAMNEEQPQAIVFRTKRRRTNRPSHAAGALTASAPHEQKITTAQHLLSEQMKGKTSNARGKFVGYA